MRKLILFLIPLGLVLFILGIFMFFMNQNTGKGALQITATPKSKVYLNDKLVGETPLCKCELEDMLKVGEYTIRIAPNEGSLTPFEEKIRINKSVLTVVDRTFANGALSEGSVITLNPLDNKKDIELLILSFPEKANVFLDNNSVGVTPLLLKNITESDHEIKLTKDGYSDKVVRIRAVAGYKLTATVYLAINPSLQVTPSASPTATPVPLSRITVLNTPTGFLNVRSTPAIGATIVATVNPGDSLELIDEQTGWFQIRLPDGKTGWVSVQYAKKD